MCDWAADEATQKQRSRTKREIKRDRGREREKERSTENNSKSSHLPRTESGGGTAAEILVETDVAKVEAMWHF